MATPSSVRPNMVGRYALLDRIGYGGVASVHLGRLVGAIGFSRVVAIKRLHPAVATDPSVVTTFMDEARLASRIRHPNVVSILDVVAASGALAVVMDYVHGATLQELLAAMWQREVRVPLGVVLSIAAGMLEGLHAAHEAVAEDGAPLQIVHRDVSPPNVIVGVDGVTRLLDFGVAKAARRMQETRGKQIKGKIAYMAPEQMGGRHVDRRADIWSASVVLWELVTCRRLFDAPNDAASMAQVLTKPVPPPSSLAPDLPAGLDRVLLRGLARDAADRFPSARDMAAAVEGLGRPLPARDVGQWVESLAGERLRARAALVALLEAATPQEVTQRAAMPVAQPVDEEDVATTLYVPDSEIVTVEPRPAVAAPEPREGLTAAWLRRLPFDPFALRVVVAVTTFVAVLVVGAALVALAHC